MLLILSAPKKVNELQIECKSRADSKAFGKWIMNASKSVAIAAAPGKMITEMRKSNLIVCKLN